MTSPEQHRLHHGAPMVVPEWYGPEPRKHKTLWIVVLVFVLLLIVALTIFLMYHTSAVAKYLPRIKALEDQPTHLSAQSLERIERVSDANKSEHAYAEETEVGLYFINLDDRKDRLKHMQENFCPNFPYTPKSVVRVPAISTEKVSYINVARSHIRALQAFEDDPEQPRLGLILEDDAEWIYNKEDTHDALERLLKDPEWSVAVLSCMDSGRPYPEVIRNAYSRTPLKCYSCAGYLVRREYSKVLRKFWEWHLGREVPEAVDVSWYELMQTRALWVRSYPKLITQMVSYSDNINNRTDYGSLMGDKEGTQSGSDQPKQGAVASTSDTLYT